MKSKFNFHQPALLKEVIEFLAIKQGKLYIDCTIGGGGHALSILKKGGKVFGIDCDKEAIEYAMGYLKKACPALNHSIQGAMPFKIVYGNFANLTKIAIRHKIHNPAGILFDLGTSLHQLKEKDRGFSFSSDSLLDMRMDKNLKVKACDLLAALSKKELNELFSRLGEEKLSLPIAHAIVDARKVKPIKTGKQLAKLVLQVYRKKGKMRGKIHPATKVFQALRIAVNDELNNLKKGLPQGLELLGKNGRLVVISFHGLEDRIVKNFLKEEEKKGTLLILTKKPIVPTWEEIFKNPRARSAKLRVAEKMA